MDPAGLSELLKQCPIEFALHQMENYKQESQLNIYFHAAHPAEMDVKEDILELLGIKS